MSMQGTMAMSAALVTALLGLPALAGAQDRYLVDWDATGEEAIGMLVDLVRIDSVNPTLVPGAADQPLPSTLRRYRVSGAPSSSPGRVFGNFLVVSYSEQRGQPASDGQSANASSSCTKRDAERRDGHGASIPSPRARCGTGG